MPQVSDSKYLVRAGWDHVPHLDEKTKKDLLNSTLPHLREARSTGMPSMGAGAIYPISLQDILVDPFPVQAYYRRAFSLDVGWNRTAAVWGLYDQGIRTWFLYAEHYRGKAEPSVHAASIHARSPIRGGGSWIPGVIDPAARGRAQHDGEQLLYLYQQQGLKLSPYKNPVDAGIYAVYQMLSEGRLKVFRTLQWWPWEYRLYRRDEDGDIVKANDHLMDATRGLVMSGLEVAITQPVPNAPTHVNYGGADPLAGY